MDARMASATATSPFNFVSYGAAGHATVYIRGLQELYPHLRPVAFVDDFSHGIQHPDFDVPIISEDERVENFSDLPVFLAVNDPKAREAIAAKLRENAATPMTLAGDPRCVSADAVLGEGTTIDPRTRVGPRVCLGDYVSAIPTLIAHDVTIGDYTTIGANATILGHVTIGKRVNIAPSATICNGRPGKPLVIGDDAVIAVGAVVTKSVAPGEVIVGNPGMPIAQWKNLQQFLMSQM